MDGNLMVNISLPKESSSSKWNKLTFILISFQTQIPQTKNLNEKNKLNHQTDMLPIISLTGDKSLENIIKENLPKYLMTFWGKLEEKNFKD